MFSFITLITIIAATVYVALMYLNASLFVIAYMEAVLFIVALIYFIICRIFVKVNISIPVGITEPGRGSIVKIHIHNKSFLPLIRMKACFVMRETLNGTKKRHIVKLSEAARGETEFIKSFIFNEAGNYEITLKKLRVYDLTGLLSVKIPVRKTAQIQVMPMMYDMPVKLSMAVRNFYGEADVYDEHKPGYDNNEIFKIREYQKGDRLQNVHWKMTAKQDELMVKEHSLPKACPVVLVLDFNERKKAKKMKSSYISALVSISYSIMDAGCAHYVAWFDEKEQDIKRVRVDDEESLFYFIGIIMKVKWGKENERITGLYREKYRAENYVWMISLDEQLHLKKGNDILTQLSKKELKKSLAESELIL